MRGERIRIPMVGSGGYNAAQQSFADRHAIYRNTGLAGISSGSSLAELEEQAICGKCLVRELVMVAPQSKWSRRFIKSRFSTNFGYGVRITYHARSDQSDQLRSPGDRGWSNCTRVTNRSTNFFCGRSQSIPASKNPTSTSRRATGRGAHGRIPRTKCGRRDKGFSGNNSCRPAGNSSRVRPKKRAIFPPRSVRHGSAPR